MDRFGCVPETSPPVRGGRQSRASKRCYLAEPDRGCQNLGGSFEIFYYQISKSGGVVSSSVQFVNRWVLVHYPANRRTVCTDQLQLTTRCACGTGERVVLDHLRPSRGDTRKVYTPTRRTIVTMSRSKTRPPAAAALPTLHRRPTPPA